ncbi:hypothetical protein Tco_0059793 [Tanacetum coccineum]
MSKSAEKSLPFFKTLKKCMKKSDFQWTTKAETAFKQMKKLIVELPTLTAPMEIEELILITQLLSKPEICREDAEVKLRAGMMTSSVYDHEMMEEEPMEPMDTYSGTDRSIPVYYGSRVGLILTSPEGTKFTYALRFRKKLLELAKIPLNENCSAMLLKKLPEKLGDPGKFLIPSFPAETYTNSDDFRVSGTVDYRLQRTREFIDEPALVCSPPPEDVNDEKKSRNRSTFSAEEIVPIPRESEDTSRSDSKNVLPSCDDFSSINCSTWWGEEAVIYPLFVEVVRGIDVQGDDIEILHNHDPSTPMKSIASILEGFIDDQPFEENDDLFDLECETNDWKEFCTMLQLIKLSVSTQEAIMMRLMLF